MDGSVIASARPTRRGRRPWHVRTLFVREPGDLGFGQRRNTAGPHREGEESKPMMHEPEKSDSDVVATKPANKAGQPVAEGVERGEREPATQVPGRDPGKRVTGAGSRATSRTICCLSLNTPGRSRMP